jgi:hypothetical protein
MYLPQLVKLSAGTKEPDPSLPSPLVQLMAHIGSPEVGQVIESLGTEELGELRHLLSEAAKHTQNMEALDRAAQWLSNHGVGITYQNPIQAEKKIDYFAELRAGWIAQGVDPAGMFLSVPYFLLYRLTYSLVLDAEEAVFREMESSRQSRESDAVAMARRAAEDPSLGMTPSTLFS